MFKEFLTLLSRIIESVQNNPVIDTDNVSVKRMIEIYPLLSEDEKNSLYEIIRSFDDQGIEYRLYFEFLCLHLYKDKRYADDIVECLLSYEMSTDKKYDYYANLGREMFVAGISADYTKSVRLEEMIANEIRGEDNLAGYIPYDERDKGSIVIVIRPFLGEYHSPTLQTINLDNYLRKLGYRTIYISYSDNIILRKYAGNVCAPFLRSELFDGTGRFEYSCFGMKIEGIHFELGAESMIDDINTIADHISQINPEFIIGIEGGNILADICTRFTDVITMNVVDDLPVTLSDCVLRYFPGEYRNRYKNANEYGKRIYDAAYDNELMPYNEQGDGIKLPEGKFHVCIMGNRLDDELDDRMLEVIRGLVKEVPESDIVFIGECPGTKERLIDISDRCLFCGYVKQCEDAVGECSLFLNPPRKGGGGGGYMAIKRGIPVYTLKDCDVASCVGKEFEHDTYDELIPLVRKCIDNREYYNGMCTLSVGNFRNRYHVNSIENIRRFCERYREHISCH